MSAAVRIVALVLFGLAATLAGLALYVAQRPPAPPPAAPVAAEAQPARQEAAGRPVAVAVRDLAAGATLSAGDVQIVHWPQTPASAYDSPQPLVGRTLRLPVRAGEPILSGMLAVGLAQSLQPNERAVTVTVDEVSGAAHRIHPGDFVDVFFLLDKGGEVGGTQARLLQSRVRVLAYGDQTVDGPSAEDKARTRDGNRSSRTAMLAVPLAQVNELLLAARSGKLQLALRAPNDEAVPDTGLFPERPPVLTARADLPADEKARLQEPVNQAYAGEALAALAGEPAKQAQAARPAAAAPRRSIEVLRGDRVERVPY